MLYHLFIESSRLIIDYNMFACDRRVCIHTEPGAGNKCKTACALHAGIMLHLSCTVHTSITLHGVKSY